MKKTIVTVLVILVCLASIWLVLAKPYETSDYVRSSSEPVTIIANYITVTGDPLCTKLYTMGENGSKEPVFPRVPADMPDPHREQELSDGEAVELKGYLYVWETKNRLTGSTEQRKVNMIDVIAWRTGDELSFETQLPDHSPSQFTGENYTSCLN